MSFELEIQKGMRALSRRDPLIRPLVKEHGVPTFHPHEDYFGSLANAIINQQISGKAAASIRARLMDVAGGELTPETIGGLPDELIRNAGISSQKLGYLRSLVEHVEQGLLKLDALPVLPDEEVIRELTAIKGIGLWTAQMFLIFTLGRLDVLPTGDLGVKKGIQIIYGLPELPSPVEVEALARERSWEPYRSIAIWYMWRALS